MTLGKAPLGGAPMGGAPAIGTGAEGGNFPEPLTTIFAPEIHTYNYPRPPQIQPLVLYDQLREQIWGYPDVPTMLSDNGLPYFDFNNHRPSIYDIVNISPAPLTVVLFSKSYTVHTNEWWRFIAHYEIESQLGYNAVNMTVPTTNAPYWDTLLGGSFWDNYQSPWDGGRF